MPVFTQFTFSNAVTSFVTQTIGGQDALRVNCVHSSLHIFPFGSTCRNRLIRMVNSPLFGVVILTSIVVNSVFFALQDPGLQHVGWLQSGLQIADPVFLAIFVLEMIVKVIAYGFIAHSKSYLRVSENVLDFIVVITGIVGLFVGVASGVSALRVFRVLRPLRTVAKVQSLRNILTKLKKVSSRMVDVFALLMFVTLVLAIFGVHLFMGVMHQRCFTSVNEKSLLLNDTEVCSTGIAGRHCAEHSNGFVFPQSCRVDLAEFQRATLNFDNLFNGFLVSFKVVTQDNWPDELHDVGNAFGEVVFIYFLVATLLAGNFCVNLFIAVLASAFQKRSYEVEEHGSTVQQSEPRTIPLAAVLGAGAVTDPLFLLASLKPHVDDAEISFDDGGNFPVGDPFTAEELTSPEPRKQPPPMRGPSSPFHRFFRRTGIRVVRKLVKSRTYRIVLVVLIALNMIVLSMNHIDAPQRLTDTVSITSFVLNVMFVADAIAKLIGLGPSYFRSRSNCFDFVLSVVSIPDLITLATSPYSALRAFRLVELLRIAKGWKSLQNLLRLVAASLQSVASLCLIASIIVYIYTILGLMLFAKPLDSLRFSFESIFDSFLTVFVVLTGESWAEIMAAAMRADGWWTAIYFISLVFLGKFLLLNLFIAIILERFSLNDAAGSHADGNGAADGSMGEWHGSSHDGGGSDTLGKGIRGTFSHSSPVARAAINGRQLIHAVYAGDDWDYHDDAAAIAPSTNHGAANVALRLQHELRTSAATQHVFGEYVAECRGSCQHIVGNCVELSIQAEEQIMRLEDEQARHSAAQRERRVVGGTIRQLVSNAVNKVKKAGSKNPLSAIGLTRRSAPAAVGSKAFAERTSTMQQWHGLSERACFVLAPSNRARVVLGKVLRHQVTEGVLVLVTLASSVFLALDSPQQRRTNPALADTMWNIDLSFVVFFGVEMLMKVLALGVVNHKGAYFRSVWNTIDAVVFATSLTALFEPRFKVGRALRVLRLMNLSFNLRFMIKALWSAIPGISTVFVLCGLLWWTYAALGIALFKGRLYHCNDPDTFEKADCTGSFNQIIQEAFGSVSVPTERRWEPTQASSTFDGIETSLYSLLKLSLRDKWFTIMYNAIDSTSATSGSRRGNSPHLSLYFLSFMILGNFFAVNLFLGVLVDRFVKKKKQGEGFSLMSEAQQRWVLSQKVLLRTRIPLTPVCPRGRIRQLCFVVSQSKYFDAFFFLLIILSSIFLSVYHYRMDSRLRVALDWCGTAIVILFTIELIIKLLALYPKVLWSDRWNRVDIFVVGLSWVAFFVQGGTSVVHIFRVTRLFLVMRKLRGLHVLLVTLYQALPQVGNVGIVLGVFYFMYAVVGVELFGNVEYTRPLSFLVNFDDVWHGLMLLYIASTAEGWAEMTDALRIGGGGAAAYPFMIIFMTSMSWIMMNLMVTVVIDNFTEAELVEDQDAAFRVLDQFREKWIANDPAAKQRLHASIILKILPTMPNSIWDRSMMVARSKNRKTPWTCMLRQLEKLHIPIDENGNVLYVDCVASLASRLFNITVDEAIVVSQRTAHGVTWSAGSFSVHHYFAARLLTHKVRHFLATRRERALEAQLRGLRDQHAMFVDREVTPLRRSHHELASLARWLAERVATLAPGPPLTSSQPALPPPQAPRNGEDPTGVGDANLGVRPMLEAIPCSDDSSGFSSSSSTEE